MAGIVASGVKTREDIVGIYRGLSVGDTTCGNSEFIFGSRPDCDLSFFCPRGLFTNQESHRGSAC